MAFCPNCGAQVEGRFCAKCGAAVGPASPGEAQAGTGPGAAPGYTPNPAYATPVYTQPAASAAGMSESMASGLCYVLGLVTGILFLVLAPYNQNKNIRFHAFQSIFLHVASIAVWIGLMVINLILPFGALHLMFSLLQMVIWLGFFALWLICIVKAFQGQRFVVPVIGEMAAKQA